MLTSSSSSSSPPPPPSSAGRDKGGCIKSFKHPSARCRHEQAKHTTAGRHQCDFPGCAKTYSRKDNLWQHQQDKHSAQRELLVLVDLPPIALLLPAPPLLLEGHEQLVGQTLLDFDFEAVMEAVDRGFD